jgi:multidrug efflux pump subunit AcrA (membrane-fusion protein)
VQRHSAIFRSEALDSHSRGFVAHDDVLHISSAWTKWSYWLLIALFMLALVYGLVGRVDEYATGVGVVRDEGRSVVTAANSGTIRRIAIRPGQRIYPKQPLVYLDDSQERIELERLRNDFNAQRLNHLKNPNDSVQNQTLATLKAQIEAAERRLKERTFLAPRGGTVQDLRIRSNQFVNPGESLLTIVGDDNRLNVIAILPGQYRPLLKNGEPLRLELAAFRYAYQHATIDDVGNEVVGPGEVRRFLGPEIADSLTLQGPSVIVKAHLPTRQFKADGRWHEYHDGMHGIAEARLRSASVLASLVPGLRTLWERGDE